MHVRNTPSNDYDHRDFARYLDELRDAAGMRYDSEVAEQLNRAGLTKFSASTISKWKSGTFTPKIEQLRWIAHIYGLRPIDVYLRSGVVTHEDLGEVTVPRLYRELIDLDGVVERVDQSQHERLRSHIEVLIEGFRQKVKALRREQRERKKKKAS